MSVKNCLDLHMNMCTDMRLGMCVNAAHGNGVHLGDDGAVTVHTLTVNGPFTDYTIQPCHRHVSVQSMQSRCMCTVCPDATGQGDHRRSALPQA